MGDWLGDSGPGIVFIQSYLCIVDCYWSKMCGLSWIELVGYRCFFLPWITCAMDREKERRNEQESWKGWVLWLFWRDFGGKNWLSFDWVWPGNVLRVSVINLSFLFFCRIQGFEAKNFAKQFADWKFWGIYLNNLEGMLRAETHGPSWWVASFYFKFFTTGIEWYGDSTPSGQVEFTQPKKVSGPQSYAEALVSVIWISYPCVAILGGGFDLFSSV